MADITLPKNLTNGTTADASDVMANFNTLLGRVNALPSTAFKPTCGFQKASADLSLTSTLQDITGTSLSITPDKAAFLLVLATWDFDMTSDGVISSWSATGDLLLDGASQGQVSATHEWRASGSELGPAVDQQRLSKVMGYVLPLTAAAHTIKMQGKRGGGSSELGGSCWCRQLNTGFLYLLVSS